MSFFIPFLLSSLAGLSTVLGTFVIFFKWQRENINKFITFCLSLSLVIMIGISVLELIPEASFIILTKFKLFKGIFLSLLIFTFSILVIRFINQKIEKGRGDVPLYRLGVLSMITLMLHNLPEGILTFLSSYQNITLGLHISIAIMLHNIPEGISIAVPIYYATGSKKKAIKMTFLSGIAEPLGALLACTFLRNYISSELIGFILLFVGGIMITLAIEELLPKAISYHQEKYLIFGGIIGIIILLINHFLL